MAPTTVVQTEQKRPRGRPPKSCEAINITTYGRKTAKGVQSARTKECTKRTQKEYAPYRCRKTAEDRCAPAKVSDCGKIRVNTSIASKKDKLEDLRKRCRPAVTASGNKCMVSAKGMCKASSS